MAVVETGSLLSFWITSLVHLATMGSLAGFLDNSQSLQVPGIARVHCTRAKPPVPILDLGGYALW